MAVTLVEMVTIDIIIALITVAGFILTGIFIRRILKKQRRRLKGA